MFPYISSRRHSRPSAGLVAVLALALSFAGITDSGPVVRAQASTSACPSGWNLLERASSNSEIPWPIYCERIVTHLATAQSVTLGQFGTELQVLAYGGIGGQGGQDGAYVGGAPGPVGVVSGLLQVTPGAVVSISTGGAGGNGTLGGNDPVAGGAGGQSASGRNGGIGGPQGCLHSHCGANRSRAGTGGGGGAATSVDIDGISYVAAGGGGGGGANIPGHGSVSGNGRPGITDSPRAAISGANGTNGGNHSPAGGGGGGGLFGGTGGNLGHGGSAGSNFAGSELTQAFVQPAAIQRAAGDNSRNGFVVLRQIALPVITQMLELSGKAISSDTEFTFDIRFSEPVTGFGLEDVVLGGSAGQQSGWNLVLNPVAGGQVYQVVATHANAPSGTLELTALASGVQAGNLSGVGQATSSLIIDREPPAVSSMSIAPDLNNPNRVRITLEFSEALSAVDLSLIQLGEDGSGWAISNTSISGSLYSFDATYTSLIAQDIKVSVGIGAAADLAGNLNLVGSEFTRLVDLTSPVATFSASLIRLNASSTTQNISLNFDRPVWGLTPSDLSFSSLCTVGTVTPSSGPAANYTVQITCAGSGTGTLTLAANSVKDFSSTSGPQSPLPVSVIRDTIAPTITSLSGTQIGNSIQYSVTFSEEIASFPASALTTTGTPSTGTWVYSSPSRVGNTNQWTFTAMSSHPLTGTHVPVFNSTATILDLAGNALTANPTFAGVAVQILPTLTVGQLSPLGASAVALAPNFEIDLRGGLIHSIRITNNSWAASGSTKDVFSNLPTSGLIAGDIHDKRHD